MEPPPNGLGILVLRGNVMVRFLPAPPKQLGDKMKYQFQISKTYNNQMKCYELLLQIGGIENKEELESFASALSEFVSNGADVKRFDS